MTRDEAADVFTHELAACELPLDVKTDLLHATGEWVYAAQQEAVARSFEAAGRASTAALDAVFGAPVSATAGTPGPVLTLVDGKERG